MIYDYKKGKKDILEILASKTPIETKAMIPLDDSSFTYNNGIKTWVTSIFVDIRDSSTLFKKNDEEKVARIIRCFTSQLITILSSDDNYRQIGIRGDCVYGVYTTQYIKDLVSIFRLSSCINTFMNMFNKILEQNSFPTINAGIGIGCSETLVIKAGKKQTGINDIVWIGDSVVDASNLSSLGNKNSFKPIVMSKTFYDNVIEELIKENQNYRTWISHYSSYNNEFYHCDIIQTDFDKWINEGMKV